MATLKNPQFAEKLPPTVTEMKRAPSGQPEDRHVARPPRDLPFLLDGDFLKVINDDNRTWDFRWGRKHYVLAPGEESFVPFEALVNALGDPRSVDNASVKYSDGQGNMGMVMDRHAEISRLYALYAIEGENMDELTMRAPRVRVETLAGQTIRFPSQLPDMLPFPVQLIDDHAVHSDSTRRMDELAAENMEYRDRIAVLEERMDRALASKEGVDATGE